MQEAEWLTCSEPTRLLEFLWEKVDRRRGGPLATASIVVIRSDLPGQTVVDDRKLRLLGVACVRALPEYLDARSGTCQGDSASYRRSHNRSPIWAGVLNAARVGDMILHRTTGSARPAEGYSHGMAVLLEAVEVADRFADDLCTTQELNAAHAAAAEVLAYVLEPMAHEGEQLLAWAAAEVSQPCAYHAALAVQRGLVEIAVRGREVAKEFPDDLKAASNFLRDIVGNPFRPAPAVDPAWLSWNEGSVPKLAQAIYHNRNFDHLSVLADAQAGAGCDNADLLDHCRHPGPHARGCWAVDLLSGKG